MKVCRSDTDLPLTRVSRIFFRDLGLLCRRRNFAEIWGRSGVSRPKSNFAKVSRFVSPTPDDLIWKDSPVPRPHRKPYVRGLAKFWLRSLLCAVLSLRACRRDDCGEASGSDEPRRRWRAAITAALRGHFGRRRPGRRPAALQNHRRRGLRWNCTKIICDLDRGDNTGITSSNSSRCTALAPPWPRRPLHTGMQRPAPLDGGLRAGFADAALQPAHGWLRGC